MNKIICLLTIALFSFFINACNSQENSPKKSTSANSAVEENPLAQEEVIEVAVYESRGSAFWEALSTANFIELDKFYAEEVLLLKGSEFLKKDWGINPNEDRSLDLLLDKKALLEVYQMFVNDKVGKDKWVKICSGVTANQIDFSSSKNSEFKHEKIGEKDIIMKVAIGNDFLIFVLRLIGDDVKVVMEYTDY